MKRLIGRLLREPLLHFLALGALIFAGNAMLHPAQGGDPHRIALGEADIERVRALYTQQWGAPPADADMRKLVDDYVRLEILAREGTALGLAADDPVVRNRLVQKMEFLLQDTSAVAKPTEPEMAAYLAAHADRYEAPERLVFRQIYFSPSLRGGHAESDARAMLTSLGTAQGRQAVDPAGDPFMLAAGPEPRSRAEIAGDFGPNFAATLFALPGGSWQGPVRSALGIHLVRIDRRLAPRLPPLAEIRDRVHDDMMAERFQAATDAAYARIRAKYSVTIAP